MRKQIYINMIRLQDLITEISIGGVEPYATQFTWSLNASHRECKIDAEGVPITFAFTPHNNTEWDFAMLAPTATPDGWTVAHSRSAAAGQLSYLRLMSTAAEALLDFAAQWQPESIDVTGSDTASTHKDLQKTRIYRMLLQANAARLAIAGYTWLYRNGKLWIVRKTVHDATGIAD
jgi:hypothetical protein